MGVFALVLGLSFVGTGDQDEPPFASPIRALSAAPLTTLAQAARLSPEALREPMAEAGLEPSSDQQSLSDLTGPDMRRQMEAMGLLFSPAK